MSSLTEAMPSVNVNVQETLTSEAISDVSFYKCDECGRGYETVRDLLAHQGTHTGEYPYVCEFCHKGYKCKTNLANHISLHLGAGSRCQTCNKVYPSAFLLRQHERFHVNEKLFACKLCGKSFKVPEFLRTHMKRAHSNLMKSCTRCTAKFSSVRALENHMKAHNVRKLKCPHCGRMCGTRKTLKYHLLCHEARADKLFPCPNCGEKFLLQRQLNRHLRIHHQPMTKHKCMYCKLRLPTDEALRLHIEEHRKVKPHPCRFCGGPQLGRHKHRDWADQRQFECPRCAAHFVFPAKLLEHAHSHGDDPAKLAQACDTCGRNYICPHQYENHKGKCRAPTTTVVVPVHLQCGSCSECFESSSALREHVKVHFDGQKQNGLILDLLCHDCGKVFQNHMTLNRHSRSHIDTNLYPCLYCPVVFKSLAPMQLHSQRHLKRTGRFRCHLCDINFGRKISLEVHIKFHIRNGDGACKKCLVAFPPGELYATHEAMHAELPKCSECEKQFENADLLQKHVENAHVCKAFVCGRCNLGLMSEKGFKTHKEGHVKEDERNIDEALSDNMSSEQPLVSNTEPINTEPLTTYCMCKSCNPSKFYEKKSHLRSQRDSAEVGTMCDPSQLCIPVINYTSERGSTSITLQDHTQMYDKNRTSQRPSQAVFTSDTSHEHNCSTAAPTSMPANVVAFGRLDTRMQSSMSQYVTPLFNHTSITVSSLPTASSIHQPVETEYPPSLLDHCDRLLTNETVVKLRNQLLKRLSSNGTVQDSTSSFVPTVSKNNNMSTTATVQKHPNKSPFSLFFELLVRILGREPVQSLSLAIMSDVHGFIRSFLPDREARTAKMQIEDTILLFIKSMVSLCDEDGQGDLGYDISHLDVESLLEEMLKCLDGVSM